MYKLIAIDIDDTLITDDKEVTPGTKAAIHQAVERGVHVTLATGRMYASASRIARQLELDVPIITYQGSLIKTALDGKVLYERHVPTDIAEDLFRYCAEHDLHIQAYHNDQLFAKKINDKLLDYCALSNVPYTIEPEIEKLASLPQTKMIIIDEPAFLDELKPMFQARYGDRVHVTKSKPNFLEFIHPEGTKGHALRVLAEMFDCPLSSVIAIGDSWNDLEMLEAAGLGVAMGNAVPALKEVADYVTLSNNEEGVRHVLEKFVLGA